MPGLLDFLGLGNSLTQTGNALMGTQQPGLDPNVANGKSPLLTLLAAAGSQPDPSIGGPSPGGVTPPPNAPSASPFGSLQSFQPAPTSAAQLDPGEPVGKLIGVPRGGWTPADVGNPNHPATKAIAAVSSPAPGAMAMPQGVPMPSLDIGQTPNFSPKPSGFADMRPAAPADAPAPNAAPAAGQGVPGAAPVDPNDPPVTLPGFKGSWTQKSAAATEAADSPEVAQVAAAQKALAQGGAKPSAASIGLGAGNGSGPLDVRPPAQGGPSLPQPQSPGVLDTISQAIGGLGNVYGRGGPFDGLINLGIGMSSGPGGVQRALQMTQQGQQAGQSQQLALAKFMREQQGQQELIPLVRAKMAAANGGTQPSDAAVAAVLADPGSRAQVTAQLLKSPEQEKADKSQLVTVKNPDGTEQQQWMVPGQATGTAVGGPVAPKAPDAVRDLQYAQQNWQSLNLPDPSKPENAPFWQDFSRQRLAGSGGVSLTMPPVEKASDQAFGKAQGDHFGAILKAGDDARQTQGQLQFMNDAFRQGGSNITTGPAAKAVLAGKQLVQGLTGVDLGGVPESEAVNKLGFGLATSLVQDISKRGGTQAEFIRGLQNVPGIFMSAPGSRVMMSILNQQAQQKIDLGQLVQDPDARKNWSKTEQQYFDTHPLVSPFTGKPLAVADLNTLRSAAQQQGIDPTTGQPAAPGGQSQDASPGSLGWSFTPGG